MGNIRFYTILVLIMGISMKANSQNDMLSKKQEKIIAISAFSAKGELEKLKTALNAGLDAGLTVNEIKEVLVHLYAYSGFPRSLRGLQTFMTVLDERKAKGIHDNMGRQASPISDTRDKYERGKEVLAKLSGVAPPEGRPTAGYAGFSPEIETFLKEHLFADIFERDVLTYVERELVTVSVIASLGRLEPMLKSHMEISLNVGITSGQLKQLTDIIAIAIGNTEAEAARVVLNEVLNQENRNQKETPAVGDVNRIFPKGDKIDNAYFNGTAWLQWLVTDKENFDITVGNVIFEPGVRNNWHSHPGGQILLCTNGKGYYQEKGEPVRLLRVGDVVEILPDVVHWHGATPDSQFEHIAIGTQTSKGPVVWLESVADEEYNSSGK